MRRSTLRPLAPALLVSLVLTGCTTTGTTSPGAEETGTAPASATSGATPDSPASSATGGTAGDASALGDLSGTVVAIDPGHNGGNAAHPEEIGAQVPDGRGGTKACNTTGTETDAGYAEHAFTWEVAGEVRAMLEDAGAEVVLSREDDEGVGPCVDERGTFAADADALVSIHGNGSEDPSASGFHVIRVDEAVHPGVEEPSEDLAEDTRTALTDAGLEPNPAYGDGIVARTDIAGLTHASVPAVLVECGEMRNTADAARMSSPEGRTLYAEAIASGLAAYLS